MAVGRTGSTSEQGRSDTATGSRPVNLEGDSPEVVAFALLRYLAQIEQGRANERGIVFDRDWLLDAYADCLEAVKGNRTTSNRKPAAPAQSSSVGKSRAKTR